MSDAAFGAALAQARQTVDALRDVMAGAVLGAYLHGSAVLGRLGSESDVDVLAVLRRRMTPAERQALVQRLFVVSHSSPWSDTTRPVELTIVVQPDVRPWRYPPLREFQYGEWLRGPFERGEIEPVPVTDPDLAPLITMTLAANYPLFGPPPAGLLDPVPHADVCRAIVEGIPGLRADLDHDARNILLTFARIWTTIATGEIRSKDGAAGWAIERLPPEHRPVVERARAMYVGDEPEAGWADRMPAVLACVDWIEAEVERLRRTG